MDRVEDQGRLDGSGSGDQPDGKRGRAGVYEPAAELESELTEEQKDELGSIRIELGLGRRTFLAVVGDPNVIGMNALVVARELVRKYRIWKKQILEQADELGVMTTRQVAQLLQLSEYYVFQLRWRGLLTFTRRIGRRYVYTAADIDRLFATNERRAGWTDGRVVKAANASSSSSVGVDVDGTDVVARVDGVENGLDATGASLGLTPELIERNRQRRGPLGHAFLRHAGYGFAVEKLDWMTAADGDSLDGNTDLDVEPEGIGLHR